MIQRSLVIYLLLIFLLPPGVMGQAPLAFSYQGIAMNSAGEPISERLLGIEIRIQTADPDAAPVFIERHEVMSSASGHFSLAVGRGIYVGGGTLATIAVLPDRYFISVSIDTNGGDDYTFFGASELLSVPYAFHSYAAMNAPGAQGPSGPSGSPGEQGEQGITAPESCCFATVLKGDKGDTGPGGQSGSQGAAGLSGLQTLRLTNVPPMEALNGQIYLDDGTNRLDAKSGFRYYDNDKWVDL